MKMLIISTVAYGKNGISTVLHNYYTDPVFSAWDISFVIPTGSDAAMLRELEERGFRVFPLRRSIKHPLGYCRQLASLIRREGFDLVHAHGNSATLALEMAAAAMGGCRIRMAHSHNTTCKHMTIHKLFNPVFQHLCTHRLACGMQAGKWLFGSREFTVINNGVDAAGFAFSQQARDAMRHHYGVEGDTLLIGHIGTFNEQKNQGFLLDVLMALNGKKYSLMLMGDGPLRPAVEQRSRELGLQDRVIFTGPISDVPAYLSACDCIAMPSLHEGVPLTLIEEQANGLRCVVSENITREADKTGNLTFLSLENAARWASVLESLPPADRSRMSAAAVQCICACGYDIHTEAAKLKAYYERAVREA